DFIKAVYPTLDVGPVGHMELKGRAFASGALNEFSGSDWLKAATLPKAEFVRLECRAERSTSPSFPAIREEVIVWARLGTGHKPGTAEEDDESVGVRLPLTRLNVMEDRLATFISSSQVRQPDIATVREA